ncbi:MAG: MmgE/PrpD family protein [Candidatus Hydrogenedentes bacterium]|nr:MmgE/PrpD family protein [Candidatus Hydrogenedentota bacterium]
MGITEEFAAFVADTKFADLPPRVVGEAKLCLLDWLGVALGGSKEPLADILTKMFKAMPGEPQATVLGKGLKTSPLNAALANGAMSHALDFDDYLVDGLLHPSAPAWGAILPLGEWKTLSGKELLAAFVLGFEVEARIARVLGKPLIDTCFHPTATVGTFGAAAAAGKALGLTPQQLRHAIGMAGTQAAGLIESFGSMSKPLHAGKAAMNGLLAALLASGGFTASEQMLDSERGFARVLAKKDLAGICEGLGKQYEIVNNVYKPYASCGATHPAIDAMLEVRRKYSLRASEVKEIRCIVCPIASHVAGKSQLTVGLEGKFSLQFCLAAALSYGELTADKFSDSEVRRADIVELMEKIRLVPNESFTSISDAEVVAVTRSGNEYRHVVHAAKGSPENPMTTEEMESKFLSLARLVLTGDKPRRVLDLVMRFDELDGRQVAELIGLCAGEPAV